MCTLVRGRKYVRRHEVGWPPFSHACGIFPALWFKKVSLLYYSAELNSNHYTRASFKLTFLQILVLACSQLSASLLTLLGHKEVPQPH
jgi:hypothetical protein